MKKTLVGILVAVLAFGCLVAAGMVGFFGYRALSGRRGSLQSGPTSEAAPGTPAERNALAGEIQDSDAPPASEPMLPETYARTRRSGSAPPGDARQEPAAPSGRTPAESTPSVHPSLESGMGKASATEPESTEPPRTSPLDSPQGPHRGTDAQPHSRPGWRLRATSEEPHGQTRRSGGWAAESEPGASAGRKPKEGGSLGFIFESRVDRGELVLRIDGDLIDRVPFHASAANRFRFTRQVPLSPGLHRVRVKVGVPGREPQSQEWSVTVPPAGSTVWKVTLDRFPNQLEVKNIP